MNEPGNGTKRILVVDDEQSIRTICQRSLSREGFDVEVAPDGEAGLDLIRGKTYDLFLFDLKMPVMGGKELYARVAEADPGMAERVVFMTGSAVGQETDEFLRKSGRPAIRKPFAIEDLKKTVKRAITADAA